MGFRANVKSKLSQSTAGVKCLHCIRRVRELAYGAFVSDYQACCNIYRKRFSHKIDLAHPTAYTEKLNWLKLFYRDADMPVCSDKYRIRTFLAAHGYDHLANTLLGVYEHAADIDFDALPNRFVAKANHGSSWNLICTDKSKLNWKKACAEMDSWMKQDLSVFGREWNYRDIPRRILIEQFIDAPALTDYKFMCFNGSAKYLQINHDFEGKHYVDFYDVDWNKVPFTYGSYHRSDFVLGKPPRFDDMRRIAEELAAQFPFVRVDFYNPDARIILGELTFFPGGGLWPLNPQETGYDAILGAELRLPDANYNLKLLQKLQRSAK